MYIDVPQTEARIPAYHIENIALIELNRQREDQHAHSVKQQEEADRTERERRAEKLKRMREEGKEEVVDRFER